LKNTEKYDIIYPREVVKSMVMVYLIFALSIFFVRLFAGYDSRYQKGKYISIKNTVLSAVLLDGMSIYGRTRRLKKDKNKMSFCGLPFYLGIGIVLLTNIVFLIIPDIPIEPWGMETNKFIVYANTLNDKISAIAILILFVSVINYIAISIIRSTKGTKPNWIKVFIWIVSALMIVTATASTIYFAVELISCFYIC
jgi:nitrate reductase gamma subunit